MSQALSKNEESLRSESYGKLFIKLTIPAVVVMLVMVLYNMADIFFIGQLGDPNQVAAVSLVGPLFSVLSGFGVLLGTGGSTAASLSLGAGDYKRVKNYSAFAFYGAIVIGLIFLAVVFSLTNPICSFLGADSGTLEYTVAYLKIFSLGAPVMILTNVLPSLVRADGSVKEGMIANMSGTLTNMVLDPIFILVFGWGVRGAAIATVLGNIVSLIIILSFLRKKKELYSISPADFRLNDGVAVKVLSLGLPMAFSTILMSFSQMLSNNLMMSYGATAVAAQSVAGRINMVIVMTVMGICLGMQPAISYNYGARNDKRLMYIINKTTMTAVLTGTVLSAIFLIFQSQILSAFLNDPSVLAIGRYCIYASIIIGPFYGFYQITTSYLQSTGKATYALIVALLEKGIIYIPMLFTLNKIFGMYGVIFAQTVTTFISIIASRILYNRARREDGIGCDTKESISGDIANEYREKSAV